MAKANTPTAAGVAQLLSYFNNILGAVKEGATVAQLWQVVKDAAATYGGDVAPATIFDMNYVAGSARALARAEAQYGIDYATNPNLAIGSQHWAWAPWADVSPYALQNPSYVIRYGFAVQGANQETATVWGQTDWQGPLSGPVSMVYERALASAQFVVQNPSPHAQRLIAGIEDPSVLDVTEIQIMRI